MSSSNSFFYCFLVLGALTMVVGEPQMSYNWPAMMGYGYQRYQQPYNYNPFVGNGLPFSYLSSSFGSPETEPLLPHARFFLYSATSTITSYISTTTCTKSTTACSGRRRRAVLADLLDQGEISPSKVNLVEETSAAEMTDVDSAKRAERKADPQFFFQQQPYHSSPYYEKQPQSAHFPYYPSSSSPYFGDELVPSLSSPSSNGQLSRFNGLLASLLASAVQAGRTSYSTLLAVSTVTSTVACSVASGFGQCPNA